MAGALSELSDAAQREVLGYRFFRNLPPAKLEGGLEALLSAGAGLGAQDEVLQAMVDAWKDRDAVGARQFIEALRQSEGGGGGGIGRWGLSVD